MSSSYHNSLAIIVSLYCQLTGSSVGVWVVAVGGVPVDGISLAMVS